RECSAMSTTVLRWFGILLPVAILSGDVVGATPARAGGGCLDGLTSAAGDTVELRSGCFEPSVLHVAAGTRVTWTNRDPGAHAVTGVGRSFGDYEQFGTDEAISIAFAEAGTYPYFCVLHPAMVGAVVVDEGT